jgi:hypothetical protein
MAIPDFTTFTPEQLVDIATRYHAMLEAITDYSPSKGSIPGKTYYSLNIVNHAVDTDGTFVRITAEEFYNRFDDFENETVSFPAP